MSEDDPFEELEEDAGSREGDPFEHLDRPDDPAEESKIEPADAPPWEDASESGEQTADIDSQTGTDTLDEAGQDPDPQAGVREGDPFESMEDAFTERGVDEIDPNTVWKQLTDAKDSGSVEEEQGRTYAEVSKHSYCEQCEFFSEPPDIDCTNEDAEIVEFLDMDTVRLVNCPIVAERKRLEES